MAESKEMDNIRDDKLRIGLKGLKRLYEANAKNMTKDEIMAFDFTFMNITNALTELQQIKSAEPTKKFVNIGDDFININSITKITQFQRAVDSYTWKQIYYLRIYFDNKEYDEFKTYDFETHKKWVKLLGIEELLYEKQNKYR